VKFVGTRCYGCDLSRGYIKTYYANLKTKAAILIMIAAEITVNVASSMPAVTGSANTTITNITNATYGGLQLMTVLPVVLAKICTRDIFPNAAAIISAVVGGFMVMRTRQ
jgi:hypothetical protein